MSTQTKGQRPSLRAVVNTGTREAPVYEEVGAAWPHKKGFTLRLKDKASGKMTDVILFTIGRKSEATAIEGGAA